MNRMLATGFGVTALMLIGVACGSGAGPAASEPGSPVSPPPAQEPVTVGLSGEASGYTDSPILQGTPRASLTYEGAVYYQEGFNAKAANFNENELELVGSTTESNTLPPGGGEGLKIYRLNDGDTYQVYTLTPGGSYQNEEDGSTITIEPEWARWSASNEAAPVASGMMLPRPNSVGELVGSAQLIVVGTIESVIEEKWIGAYDEDGKPAPVSEGGMPVTDYDLRIENSLMGYSTDADGDSLVLRMFGHLSNSNAVITPDLFTLPNPGDRLLFALGRNPDGTYGSGPEGLLKVDGEKVEYVDGVAFSVDVSPEQFLLDIAAAIMPPCCKP